MVRITLSTQGWTIAEAATPDQTVDLAHRDPPPPVPHRRRDPQSRAARRSARAAALLRSARSPAPARRGPRDHAGDQSRRARTSSRTTEEGDEALVFRRMRLRT